MTALKLQEKVNEVAASFPRGFGFVEMPDDAAGQKAIDELNGAEFDHKQISVNVARPREERPSNGGNRDRRGGYNSRRY